MENASHPTFGNGKICYIELPSKDINESATFYHQVFNWQIRKNDDGTASFDDAVTEVSGTWRTDRKPVNELGIMIHIMVYDIDATIALINENGGEIIQPVDKAAREITASFSDPTGNVLGLYQHGGR
ncbi:VOC family protein [Ferruginibacter sp. SUN106]|uniref:VOC family protein n=1 Tax=Ferruginibacter sp. SUN106 TaxID=2978348 RepID=UPI003D365903